MWRTRRRRTPVLLCSLFFALPPLTSFHPFSVSFFFLPLCLLLFFHEQYDAITGKNGKTFPPALVVFYNYPFPRLLFRPQVIVRDPLSLFFLLWITPERSFVPSCTHDPRIQFTFPASSEWSRGNLSPMIIVLEPVDYNRIYGYNNERVRNLNCLFPFPFFFIERITLGWVLFLFFFVSKDRERIFQIGNTYRNETLWMRIEIEISILRADIITR